MNSSKRSYACLVFDLDMVDSYAFLSNCMTQISLGPDLNIFYLRFCAVYCAFSRAFSGQLVVLFTSGVYSSSYHWALLLFSSR